MQGDVTRSKSNKGPVDGQFSHDFLHQSVWRGRFAGVCADEAVPQFWSILARGSASKGGFLRPCPKTVWRYCWREYLERRLRDESERSGNDRRDLESKIRGGHAESGCVTGHSLSSLESRRAGDLRASHKPPRKSPGDCPV